MEIIERSYVFTTSLKELRYPTHKDDKLNVPFIT